MKILLYCTKDKYEHLYNLTYLHRGETFFGVVQHNKYSLVADNYVNGKIVAQCDCDLVESFDVPYPAYFCEVEDKLSHITQKSCLSLLALHHYLKIATGYAMHLSNVKVFDKPESLPTLKYIKRVNDNISYVICNAPQNMMYAYDTKGNKYILMSIHPRPLCKILNGEKTIEIRKKILNDLRDLINE